MPTFAQRQNQRRQKSSASLTRSNRLSTAASQSANPLLHLQRTIGNQAVLRSLQARAQRVEAGSDNEVGATNEVRSETLTATRFAHDFSGMPVHTPAPITIQPKLTVNTPGDIYEQEADHIAEQVMRMPEPKLQRACACGGGCSSCQTDQPKQQHQHLQTKHVGASDTGQVAAPPIVHDVLASPGQPLDASTREFFEPRFGQDFSHVRVHSGETAVQSARDVNAKAYTVGHNVVVGAGQFAPETQQGRRLIAHELAHVIQQTTPSAETPTLSGDPTLSPIRNSIETGVHHLPSGMLQREVDTETEANWNKLSAPIREEVEEMDDECDGWIAMLVRVQMSRPSSLRAEWLDHLRRMSTRIGDLDSDSKLADVKNAFTVLTTNIGRLAGQFSREWLSLEKRSLDELQWLRSKNVKSIDSIQAAKYLEEIYLQTKPKIPAYLTPEEYVVLKDALDKQEYIRVGALRGVRIRAKQLKQMMDTVEGLLRKGENANKFIPDWSERVSEEAAYLDSFARLAKERGRAYAGELADLRKELLQKQEATGRVKPPQKSGLEKAGDFATGVVEGIAGIFVEAAKQAVDLVQINLHFVSLGKYEPRFISDLAAAAEQGATTTDLLKGMVTGLLDTPSRFLKACRDGDWEAIGKESVNLYLLAKTIKEVPQSIKKIPEGVKKLPELLAKTRESIRILRGRTVALGLKSEARFTPEPAPRTPAAPKPAPAPVVKQGGGQGSGKPTGMLRDTDSPTRGVNVDASHPVLKNKTPANDQTPPPPQGQGAKVAVNATKDLPRTQKIDPSPGTPAPGQLADPARMGKKPPTSTPIPKKDSGPPAEKLDPGEGETTRKARKNRGDDDDLPRKEKISDSYNKPELEQSPQLIARLPDLKHRQRYMKWLIEGHQGRGHPHINPAKDLEGSLLQFSQETGITLAPKK